MVFRRLVIVALLAAGVALTGCYATSTTSTTWGVPAGASGNWARPGRVEYVRETVHRQQGNPAAGAAAGAIIGGFLGHAFLGYGPGAFFGAASGAAIGASESRGATEARSYEVFVRYDDGVGQVFVYRGASPFRPGDRVALTPQGLAFL